MTCLRCGEEGIRGNAGAEAHNAVCPGTVEGQLARALARVRELEVTARRCLEASELGVSELESMRRVSALAKLVGYDAGSVPRPRGLPEDLDELSREASRLAKLLSEEVEVEGSGWAFALFLFREARAGEAAGHVLQVSRDREKTALAVARWLKDTLDQRQAKARGVTVSTYAKRTVVSPEKSRNEVERTLARYGASGFGYSWERREVVINPVPVYGAKTELREFASIIFEVKKRRVRLDVPMPSVRESGTQAKQEAATRQRWRALTLVIKAKLEAVEAGISTLESEFLANIVTENGRTIGELLVPQLSEAVRAGRLLPPSGEARS